MQWNAGGHVSCDGAREQEQEAHDALKWLLVRCVHGHRFLNNVPFIFLSSREMKAPA